jgi:hypothetical protein
MRQMGRMIANIEAANTSWGRVVRSDVKNNLKKLQKLMGKKSVKWACLKMYISLSEFMLKWTYLKLKFVF